MLTLEVSSWDSKCYLKEEKQNKSEQQEESK